MTKHRYSRREFMGLSGAGVAGLVGAQWPRQRPRRTVPRRSPISSSSMPRSTRSIRLEPRAQAFAVKAGRFVAVGSSEDVKSAHRQADPDLRRQADDDRAGVHRRPQSRARRDPALRGPGRQSVRGRVRHHRQHRRQAPRARRARRPPGFWVEGYLLRRHQGEGQARAQHPRPRPGVERAPGRGPPPRRPHHVSTTARRSSWPASPRTRPTPAAGTFDRDANGELNGRVTDRARGRVPQGRQAAELYGASRRGSATATR